MTFRGFKFLLFRHHATLKQVFKEPPSEISWTDIEGLLEACGAEFLSGVGDSTRIRLNGVIDDILVPDDGIMSVPIVNQTRTFFEKAGLTPQNALKVL
jgi:hypothetical protein